ncbi:MAG: GtrA family protein [Paramuribaculum sp.]|nr:GtrA family protein [Paramuribaculum sp.]
MTDLQNDTDSTTPDSLAGRIGKRVMTSDSLIFTFLRSVVSSQAASWVDLGLGFVFFSWLGLAPWLSTAIGAVAGGIVNCIINYRFTFHAQGVSWRAVIVKYSIVWIGSILLNSGGTQAVYSLIKDWHWLETIGFKPDGYYAAARLFVSLMVSWFWNFVLQRYFVYRPTRFDKTAEEFVDRLRLNRKS